MRLLIDKCVDENVWLMFPGHDCHTARFAKLAGLKNGRLLDAAERARFYVLLTIDQNIPEQQNLSGRSISILILRTYQWCPTGVNSPCRQAGKSLISWRTAVGTVTSAASSAATSIEARRARPERESCAAARIAGAV
jgi:hypothetical protein